MARHVWFYFLSLVLLQVCGAYKILVLFPMAGKSHAILGDNVVRHLLKAGHEVTYATPFVSKNSNQNLRVIDVSANLDILLDSNIFSLQSVLDKNSDLASPLTMFHIMTKIASDTLENPNMADMLRDTSRKFDVVIVEWMFSDVYAGLATLYQCPLVWVSTLDPHWMTLALVDEATNPAYVPDFASSAVAPLTFMERVQGLFTQIMVTAMLYFYFNGVYKDDYNRIFTPYLKQRGREVPPFEDVVYNGSLFLSNSHASIGQSIRLPQNYIPIGGYHIDDDLKPLPEDLKKLLDNSKSGLIYFSLGSNIKSKDLPDVLKQGLVKFFSELKQTVLWKFEENLPNLPSNVHIVDWAPQQSILAHPNCILFITHGGLLSTSETIHFGKPIVGIPIFGDQFTNIDRAVKKGYAIRVDLSYSLIEDLKAAVDEILSDPKYRNKAKELSRIYHDRAVSPGAELVHWVEHVVRTGGAPHLRSPALHVPCYQKYYLDLIALVLTVIIVLKIFIKRVLCSNKNRNAKKKIN